MSLAQSPSHTFQTTNPELFSTEDETPYAAICLIPRASNAAPFQFGGAQITTMTGGASISTNSPGFWVAIPNRPVRLTEIFVAGAVGDVVDTVCFPAEE